MDTLTGISLFSGAGGLDLAARSCGIRTVAYCEWNDYAQGVLMSRIRDKRLDDAPIWDDITTFDGRPFLGSVDIVFGGFPCQPHSVAGKRGGADDARNLWPDTLRILRESGAWGFVGENVPGIVSNGYAATVLADLEREGFCGSIFSNTACAVGAPHMRERVFFVAHSTSIGRNRLEEKQENRPKGINQEMPGERFSDAKHLLQSLDRTFSDPGRGIARNDDGLGEGMDRLRCTGNGVVAGSAIPAFEKLKKMITARKAMETTA